MARQHPVPSHHVELHAGFWRDRYVANRDVGIPSLFERLDAHGVIDNFRRLHPLNPLAVERRGFWFTDSDLYKWMEAAAWVAFDGLDGVVDAVLGAQSDDGYLNTNFSVDQRFQHLDWSHELYCAGHFIQAAVARWYAQGNDDLLDGARRCADHIEREFIGSGRTDRDRHPVIEMALVELYRATGTARHLDLATYFCDLVPWAQWERPEGHAVCALYFASGLTDIAIETGDARRADAVRRWWDDIVATSTYVTGAIGGRWTAEAVGERYEMPQARSYTETCGAIAAAQWHARMLQLDGRPEAADALAHVWHNALAAGMSTGGDEWFYANPHATTCSTEEHPWIGEELPAQIAGPLPLRRAPWRDVTCCPPNINRAFASLPGQLYTTDDTGGLYVNIYSSSRVRAGDFDVTVETELPRSGATTVTVNAAPSGPASIFLHQPRWSNADGTTGYREERRVWNAGDTFTMDRTVDSRLLRGNPRVESTRGSVALQRGPFVYCLEGVDNPAIDDLRDVAFAPDATFRDTAAQGLDVVAVTVDASLQRPNEVPFVPVDAPSATGDPVEVTAIPYFAWANRTPSPMTVWVQQAGH